MQGQFLNLRENKPIFIKTTLECGTRKGEFERKGAHEQLSCPPAVGKLKVFPVQIVANNLNHPLPIVNTCMITALEASFV